MCFLWQKPLLARAFREKAIFKNTSLSITICRKKAIAKIDFRCDFHDKLTIDQIGFYDNVIFGDAVLRHTYSGKFSRVLLKMRYPKTFDLRKTILLQRKEAEVTGIILEQHSPYPKITFGINQGLALFSSNNSET